MTPEQQRIAIAEVCGWKPHGKISRYPAWRHPDGRRCTFVQLPRYEADLNALHDAEKVLTEEQGINFVTHLHEIFERTYEAFEFAAGEPRVTTWFLLGATAPQRAEAFLRTLNLWVE